jgi:transposase
VASIAKAHEAEVISRGRIGTRQGDLDQRLRKRPSTAKPLLFVSEAGPCGSWLYRSLTKTGADGGVVAPSLVPQQPGDRVNADRRDAVPLARLARSGALPAVDVPTVEDDARRELTRAREDTLRALQSATCRLKAFWLRHASRDTGRATWGPAHLRWRSEVVCPTPPPQLGWQDSVRAVHEQTERRQRLDQARQDQVTSWHLPPVVDALQARRGVPCTVAVTRGAESGDLTRGDTPRERMKCWGLIPAGYAAGGAAPAGSAYQSGSRPGPQSPGRRRLGLPRCRPGQSTPATATGNTAQRSPRPQVESPAQAGYTLPPTRLPRQPPQRGHGGHGAAASRVHVGPCHAGAGNPLRSSQITAQRRSQQGCQRAADATPPRCGVTLGSVPRLVQETRAEREAGTRRRPLRWDPTHGEPPDHPSTLTGSGSSDARRVKTILKTPKSC